MLPWPPGFLLLYGLHLLVLMPSDSLSCRQLTQLVGEEKSADLQRAQALLAAAGTTPQLKSVASQSMALLLIRAREYSAAWKQANDDSQQLAKASRSVQMEHEKIKLWLLVEARSNQAENQLKRLVTLTINTETEDVDRQDSSFYLGKLLKLLDCCEASCGVQRETISRARQALATQSSKSAVKMYEMGWAETEKWDSEVRSILEKVQDAATARTAQQDLQDRFDSAKQQFDAVRAAQKSDEDLLDEKSKERDGLASELRAVQQEMRRETPGRPRPVAEPNTRPPHRPSANATQADWRRYDQRLQQYEVEQRRYRSERREFERLFADWTVRDQARRTQLNALSTQLNQSLSGAVAALKTQQDKLKETTTHVLHQQRQLRQLQQQINIADLVVAQLHDQSKRLPDLQRPSLYPLLDFPRESARLSKMVADHP